MKSFTDDLQAAIQARGDALSGIDAATGEVLDAARSSLGHVAVEHQARAEELKATLESHWARCRKAVAEMRHGHQEALRSMRDHLNHTLSEARRVRQAASSRMI
jgi:hypothetical protein